jgi:hypothetical protein
MGMIYLNSWSELGGSPRKIGLFAICLLCLVVSMMGYGGFLELVETRPGVILDDPILKLFAPINLSLPINILVYLPIVTVVFVSYKNPAVLLRGILSYNLMILTRIIMMYVTPLDPPITTIVLDDPLVGLFSTGGKLLTRDLFFSGHTATTTILFLIVENKVVKRALAFLIPIIGVLVLLQHLHYTIDVLVAPFVAFGCFKAAGSIHQQLGKFIHKSY